MEENSNKKIVEKRDSKESQHTEEIVQIPIWKIWLTVITVIMVLMELQNYQSYRQTKQEIYNLGSMLNQELQLQNEYQQDLIQIFEKLP